MTEPKTVTVSALIVFFLFFIVFLFKKTAKNSLDVFDFLCLSTVAFMPLLVVIFPDLSFKVSHGLGVEYPFVVLFGFLFFSVFFYLLYLVSKIRRLQKNVALLTQEIALFKDKPKQ